jgi:hypothetical protein
MTHLKIIRLTSINILKEWLKYCQKEEYINGQIYGKLHKDFRWSTPEQSILGIIFANYVRKHKYNIPLKYPFISMNRNFTFYKSKNYDYLKYINK